MRKIFQNPLLIFFILLLNFFFVRVSIASCDQGVPRDWWGYNGVFLNWASLNNATNPIVRMVTVMVRQPDNAAMAFGNKATGYPVSIDNEYNGSPGYLPFNVIMDGCDSVGGDAGETSGDLFANWFFVTDSSASSSPFYMVYQQPLTRSQQNISAYSGTWITGNADCTSSSICGGSLAGGLSGFDSGSSSLAKQYLGDLYSGGDLVFGTFPLLTSTYSTTGSLSWTSSSAGAHLLWPPSSATSSGNYSLGLGDFYGVILFQQQAIENAWTQDNFESGAGTPYVMNYFASVCENIFGVSNNCPWFGPSDGSRPSAPPVPS